MISFKTILTEDVNLYQGEVILKNKRSISQKDIFNQLRALSNVIVVTPIKDSYLDSQRTENDEYAKIKIKFINSGDPLSDLKDIKSRAMSGKEGKTVDGLLQFIIRVKTLLSISR